MVLTINEKDKPVRNVTFPYNFIKGKDILVMVDEYKGEHVWSGIIIYSKYGNEKYIIGKRYDEIIICDPEPFNGTVEFE